MFNEALDAVLSDLDSQKSPADYVTAICQSSSSIPDWLKIEKANCCHITAYITCNDKKKHFRIFIATTGKEKRRSGYTPRGAKKTLRLKYDQTVHHIIQALIEMCARIRKGLEKSRKPRRFTFREDLEEMNNCLGYI